MKTLVYMTLGAVLAMAGSSASADGFSGGPFAGGVNPSASGGKVPSPFSDTPAYGLDGGYDWRLGRSFMLGVEGHMGVNADAAHTPTWQYGSNGYGLGLKVGVPLDSLMPYAHLSYDHIQGLGTMPGFNGSGTNGGLGLAYKFAPHWSVEGEWSTAGPATKGIKFKANSINFGVNYQFGSSGGAPSK